MFAQRKSDRRSFLSSRRYSAPRLALITLIVFGLSVIAGFTVTAKAPGFVKAMVTGSSSVPEPVIQPVPLHPLAHLLNAPSVIETTVYTDKPNYQPGETAIITGSGFWPNEVVTLQVVHTDGIGEGGAGHAPWTVTADDFGNFTTTWFVDPDDSGGSTFLLTALGASSGLNAETSFTDGSANLDTCANGPSNAPVFCTGGNWDNGNLTSSKSHYFEGNSVPYRAVLSNLIAGNTYTLTIEYDTTQGGKHAFDYLTSFDATEAQPGNNPCTQKSGNSVVNICNVGSFNTLAIPTDPNVTANSVSQAPGVFTLYNGDTMSIVGGPYTLSGSYAGNSSTAITVQFNATDTTAVLAWGGHISTRPDWGPNNSAISINGSPYHMRLTALSCSGAGEICNVGNQDHQLSAEQVFFPIQLTIIKETNPDDAQVKTFNYTTTGNNLGPFSLTPPNGTTPAQTQFSLTDTTARTVTESDPHASAPQFTLTGLSCTQTDGGLGTGTLTTDTSTRTVSFTPKEGQSISCTFTNEEDFDVTRGKIIVDKVTNPSGDPTSFDFTTTYGSPFSLTDAAPPNNSGFLLPGSYQVSEAANSDYTTSATCTSSLGQPAENPNSINLDAGEIVTCTFTNTKKPKLTVTKILVPSNDSGKFNLQIDGVTQAANVGDGGTTGAQFVSIGSHTVGETAGTGTDLNDYTTAIGGDCDAAGNVSLAAGENKTCTITNTRRPKLTVTKILVPSNDTGKFNLQIDGVTQAANVGDGGTTGAQFVTVGSHTVGETAGTGTDLNDYTTVIGGDCAANGSVSLAAGESKSCTITNTRKPKLTVTKILVPSNDSGKFNLQIDGVTQAANVGDGGTTGAQFVSIGSHTVGETAGTGTDLNDYTTLIGGDCAPNGSVSLNAGDNKTCTITNTRKPKLTVTKILLPSNDTGKFNLQVDGVTQAANVGDGGTTGAQFVTIGSHTVGESAGTGTDLNDYTTVIGGDCDAFGNVNLAAGENKTCTITNTRRPKLTVTKILVPSNDTGKFNLQIDGGTQAANVGDGGTTGAQFVTVGSHTVGETAGTGTSLGDYTTEIGGDCDAAGNVTLAAGESKSCTITNTRRPKLTVTKILAPSNDTGKFNLQIDGGTQAANVGNNGTTGAQFVTIGSHSVGETAGTGTSLGDYTTLIGGDCDAAGNVSLAAGESKTCTITNTRRPKLTVTKILVPSNDTGLFNLQVDGGTQAANVGNNGTTGAQFVNIGSHTVGETAGTGTSLGDYTTIIGGDCDASGNVSLAAGQSKTCTITNTRRPRLTVTKILLPANDTGLFNLKIDGVTLAANVGNNGSTGPQFVTIGGHTASETAGTGTSLGDYVTTIGGDCAANGAVSLVAGDNKACTITNKKKGMAQVVKTVKGQPPAANQSFTFELRQGASTSSDGTVLESTNTDASGNINFTTKLNPGDTYQICEWVFPAWNSNLAGDGPLFVPSSIIPPALPNPNVNNLTVCANFTVQPGQTRTFTVDNTPPPGGRALTIGFWKNWSSCTGGGQKPMLDLALGLASANTTNPAPGGLVLSAQNPGSLWPNYAPTFYLVLKGNPLSTPDNIKPSTDCTKAVNLLNKSTIDGKKKMASDPLFNLTAQLLGAELNRFVGAGINGITIANIDRAVVLVNGKYKFNGLTYTPALTTADTNTANCLATQLDNYNNGRPVGLCP